MAFINPPNLPINLWSITCETVWYRNPTSHYGNQCSQVMWCDMVSLGDSDWRSLAWHRGNYTVFTMPVKQPWNIRINQSHWCNNSRWWYEIKASYNLMEIQRWPVVSPLTIMQKAFHVKRIVFISDEGYSIPVLFISHLYSVFPTDEALKWNANLIEI